MGCSGSWLALSPTINGLVAFDGRNLVKGPSYSMFIYASYRVHIPIMMAEQLFYLLAAAVMGTAFGRLGRSRWLGGVTFAVLAVNPVHLGAVGSLLIREVFYTSVSILLIGSVLLAGQLRSGTCSNPVRLGICATCTRRRIHRLGRCGLLPVP